MISRMIKLFANDTSIFSVVYIMNTSTVDLKNNLKKSETSHTHYLPTYERGVWHYQKANVDQIRKAISEFPCDNSFANINVNDQLQLITQKNQNIISNFIPQVILLNMN